MIPARFFHTPSSYVRAVESLEPLLACAMVLFFALAFYLMRHGIARCYRQACSLADAFSRARPMGAVSPPAMGRRSFVPVGGGGNGGGVSNNIPQKRVDLYSCLEHSPPGVSLFAKKIKLTLRALLHRDQTRRWLAYWNLTPAHSAVARATPRLLQKIYRPYQSLRLRRPERLDMLISHYDFIFQRGLTPLILKAAHLQVLIATFPGKSGDLYEVRLSAISSLDREGEMALHLYRGGRHLFSTAFTFYRQDMNWCVGVGCLQGPCGADAKDRIRRATRDMFGLRPKALMVRLVREISHAYGCKNMVLVGNKNRVTNHRSKVSRLYADYDHFWREIGAARRADGDYEILCGGAHPGNPWDLPSKKRAEARRRLSLAEEAIADVRRALVGNWR